MEVKWALEIQVKDASHTEELSNLSRGLDEAEERTVACMSDIDELKAEAEEKEAINESLKKEIKRLEAVMDVETRERESSEARFSSLKIDFEDLKEERVGVGKELDLASHELKKLG